MKTLIAAIVLATASTVATADTATDLESCFVKFAQQFIKRTIPQLSDSGVVSLYNDYGEGSMKASIHRAAIATVHANSSGIPKNILAEVIESQFVSVDRKLGEEMNRCTINIL